RPPGDAFRLGYLWGLAAYGGVLWWMTAFGLVVWALAAAFAALAPAAAMLAIAWVERDRDGPFIVLWIPLVWTAVEFLRSQGALGIPWALLGATQHRAPPVIQIASVGGVYAVSFLVALVNVALYVILTRRAGRHPRSSRRRRDPVVGAPGSRLPDRQQPGRGPRELRVRVWADGRAPGAVRQGAARAVRRVRGAPGTGPHRAADAGGRDRHRDLLREHLPRHRAAVRPQGRDDARGAHQRRLVRRPRRPGPARGARAVSGRGGTPVSPAGRERGDQRDHRP